MRLYLIDKLTKAGGKLVKRRPVLATSDSQAVEMAAQSDDCPVCDVLRDGERVGRIL